MEACKQNWQIVVMDRSTLKGSSGLCMLMAAAPITNGKKSKARLPSVLPDYLLDALGFMRDPELDRAHQAFAPMSLQEYRRRHPEIRWNERADGYMTWGHVTLEVPAGVHRVRRGANEKGRDFPLQDGEPDWRKRWDRYDGTIIHTEEEAARFLEWAKGPMFTTEHVRLGQLAATPKGLTLIFPVLIPWRYGDGAGRASCGACGARGYTHSSYSPDDLRCLECDECLTPAAKRLVLDQRPDASAS